MLPTFAWGFHPSVPGCVLCCRYLLRTNPTPAKGTLSSHLDATMAGLPLEAPTSPASQAWGPVSNLPGRSPPSAPSQRPLGPHGCPGPPWAILGRGLEVQTCPWSCARSRCERSSNPQPKVPLLPPREEMGPQNGTALPGLPCSVHCRISCLLSIALNRGSNALSISSSTPAPHPSRQSSAVLSEGHRGSGPSLLPDLAVALPPPSAPGSQLPSPCPSSASSIPQAQGGRMRARGLGLFSCPGTGGGGGPLKATLSLPGLLLTPVQMLPDARRYPGSDIS